MSAMLEARAIITASDQTKGAFDSLEARIKAASTSTKALGGAMGAVNRVSGQMKDITGSISRAEASLGAFGQSARAVDEVSAAVNRAAKSMPQLAGQAAALSKATTETAAAGRAFAAELARIDTASARLGAFKTLQGGFAQARRDFAGAKTDLVNFAKQVEASDAKVTKLTADLAAAKEAANRAWEEGVAGARASRGESMQPYHAASDERNRIANALHAESEAGKKLQRSYEDSQYKVSAAAKVLEAQKAALIGVKREVESLVGGPMQSLSSAEAKLKIQAEGVNQAMVQQAKAALHAAEAGTEALHVQERKAHRGAHAGSQLAEIASLYGTIEAGEAARRVIERYREFDKERRYGQVVMGISDKEQEPLVEQAIHESGKSKFNDIQWLETQRELAARGYNKDQVMAFAPIAAQLGQAFDVSMPEGVLGLEGAMLSFKKDTSTYAKALASAQRTADLQVKASKISGMTHEDVVQLYKIGAAPAQMAHLSEESLLAFGAISKKSNMGGDESGIAFRALAKNMISPTAEAQVALRAAGIDYNKFQNVPDHLDTAGFVDTVAKKFGVALDNKAVSALDKLFKNKSIIGDAAKFMPAVREVLGDVLGGDDAKSKGKIAGLARNYRDASMRGVDADGLMAATITAMAKNPALANAVFGSKQGGRIYAALGDPDVLNHILDELKNQSQGFAKAVSEARMAGFDGALSKLSNSIANVESALGRAWDGGGSGGLLTGAASAAAGLAQAFAEANPVIQRTVTEISALGAAAAAVKGFGLFQGGFGLSTAAEHLQVSASQLDLAARSIQAAESEQAVVPGLGPKVAKGAAVAEGAVAAEAVEIVATGAASITVGTLAIAGVAAFALLDWLSHSGPKRPRASDDPNFGNPFAASRQVFDPVTGKWIDAAQAKPFEGTPRSSVRSKRAGEGPGEWVIGRGGARQWVPEQAPKAVHSFFAENVDLQGNPILKGRKFGSDHPHIDFSSPLPAFALPSAAPTPAAKPAPHSTLEVLGGSNNVLPLNMVQPTFGTLPTRPMPAGLHPDFTFGNNDAFSPGYGASDHFARARMGNTPHIMTPADHVDRAPDMVGKLQGLLGDMREAAQPHEDLLGKLHSLKATIDGPVTAQLQGTATVSADITVGPSSQLLTIVSQVQSIRATGNLSEGTTGSVGPSRVAAAPGVGRR